jgi:hypothetical protein
MPSYVLGIDLGTTNSVLAYAPLGAEKPEVQLLPIPQLVAPGVVESRTTLPSFLYLAAEHEGAASAFDLPWRKGNNIVVGELARRQSAEQPQRTVAGAKSWLAHSKVDRHQPILPWGAPAEVPKVSPVTASRRYLEHMVAAWEHAFPDAPISVQTVVLTVPASFDAAARELTREAALTAGLPASLILLEEPQAAVYSWLTVTGDRWRRMLKVGETLLVCDVGGGTTDLTLVGVDQEGGELMLRRIAVGDHLLVGGDNMDLALAHFVAGKFAEKGVKLDPWQSVSLWHQCRAAKEVLLAEGGPKKHPLSVLGRGSKLIGGTVKVEIERDAASALLLEGFFPKCAVTERPARRQRSGFQELGLPFESDTAATRHLATFLTVHGKDNQPIRPTHVLFNGGVFKADDVRTVGVCLPRAPEIFMGNVTGVRRTKRRNLEVDLLALPEAQQQQRGLPPQNISARVMVCSSLASVAALFERCGMAYLDWSYANAFWSPTQRAAYVIDVDGCSFGQARQIDSPGWSDPLVPKGSMADSSVDINIMQIQANVLPDVYPEEDNKKR